MITCHIPYVLHYRVNISVGSKIQAIVSSIACMMFRDIAMKKP
jgi:hypothetical protein